MSGDNDPNGFSSRLAELESANYKVTKQLKQIDAFMSEQKNESDLMITKIINDFNELVGKYHPRMFEIVAALSILSQQWGDQTLRAKSITPVKEA